MSELRQTVRKKRNFHTSAFVEFDVQITVLTACSQGITKLCMAYVIDVCTVKIS